MRTPPFKWLIGYFILVFISCKKDDSSSTTPTQVSMVELIDANGFKTILNPYNRTPLSAELTFISNEPSLLEIEVLGAEPIAHSFDAYTQEHAHPIIGLYPATANKVVLKLTTVDNQYAFDTLFITTDSVYTALPSIKIDTKLNTMEEGMHLADVHLGVGTAFESHPLVFDNNGIIRYHLDLSDFGSITWPIQKLQNGNFLVTHNSGTYELDKLGQEIRRYDMAGYRGHHEVLEMPSGNFLVAVQKYGTEINNGSGLVASSDDFVIEINRVSGAIVQEWDLRQVLDVDRHDVSDGDGDWFHMNGIWYSSEDDCLIISGRNQGVVKVDRNNNLKWILAAHTGWGKAGTEGQGEETSPFLLNAIDAAGTQLSQEVQLGNTDDSDFDWTWGQHAPMLLPNGNVLVFDNGFNRQFGNAADSYSRAVEYEINETNGTVKQVWEYGKERGSETSAAIISDVDYLPNTTNILFSPGIVSSSNENYAKIIEITRPGKQVMFEATLNFKNLRGNGQFVWGQMDIMYRAERLNLYP